MNKKKFAIIFGAIVVAAVAAAVIWYFFGDGRHDSKDRVYVEKVSVIMGTATGAQNRYSGVVQPQKSVEINADSDRTVKEVLVNMTHSETGRNLKGFIHRGKQFYHIKKVLRQKKKEWR